MKQILEDLEPHLGIIVRSIEVGLSKGWQHINTSPYQLSKSAIANVLNDCVFGEIRNNFNEEQCIGSRNSLRGLVIGKIIIKFKKLDKRFLTANIPTKQVKAFNRQQRLPFLDAEIYLNAGWIFDATGTKLRGIFLTKPRSNSQIEWKVDLGAYLADNDVITHDLTASTMPLYPAIAEVAGPKVKDAVLADLRRIKKANE